METHIKVTFVLLMLLAVGMVSLNYFILGGI